MDTPSKTQMAEIMVHYGSSSGSSWKEFVRSSFGRTVVGRQFEEVFVKTWIGIRTELRTSSCSQETRSILINIGRRQSVNAQWDHCWKIHKNVWITCFWWSNRKITWMEETPRKNNCMVLWHGRTRSKNVWKGRVNWQTRKPSNCKKFHVHAWIIINSSRKSLNQLENYLKYAHILSWNACTWHELAD